MAQAVNPETIGELGELRGFENLPQREIEVRTSCLTPESFPLPACLTWRETQDVQIRLRQLYSGLLEESVEVMYEGQLVDVKNMELSRR